MTIKKKLWIAFGVFIGVSVLLLGSSALITLQQRHKVRENQSEMKKTEKRAQKLTQLKRNQKPITYRNQTGHLYYQTDSIWGKQIYESAQRWNKQLGSDVLLASGNGQLVDLFITDNTLSLPQQMDEPIYAEMTMNHVVGLNTSYIVYRKLSTKQVNRLIDAMFASALGANQFSGQLFGKKALASTINKNNTDNIRNTWNEAKGHVGYNSSILPTRSDLADHGVINYECAMLLLPQMQQDAKLNKSKLKSIEADGKSQILAASKKKSVTVGTISKTGDMLKSKMEKAYVSVPMPASAIKKISKQQRMQNTILTIAGTSSTIVDDNGGQQ
ncbi:hypothetical protein [Lactiplantibacillus plantarum]|uniref:hypothetical protein n=1 Tax=Lactiplantibacillus plantarum TaxID=1590 RepID=UPI002000F805|nr:hypothetical protein [Lactiplantibacillus plantarum]